MKLRFFASFIIGFLSSDCISHTIDWCSTSLRCSEAETKNTMCTFGSESENKGNCTEQEDLVQKNNDIRNYWLALHNTFRDQVAGGFMPGLPSASNMLQLVWDDTLTSQAKRWAFQCKYEDDPCSRSPKYHNLEPETVYNETRLLGKLVADTKAAVLARFLENVNGHNLFPVKLIQKIDVNSFRTYEQVNFVIHAFAQIREIGAALILYKWFEGGKFHPFLKSNTYFGPPIIKGSVYERGKPCSACPEGYRCNRKSTYTHLCAKPHDPANQEYTDKLPGAENARNEATKRSYLLNFIEYSNIHLLLIQRGHRRRHLM